MTHWEDNAPDLVEVLRGVLHRQLETREGRPWSEDDAYHASDLAGMLPADDGGLCTKQRLLKWQGAEVVDDDPWKLLMFDQGFSFETKLEQLLNDPEVGLPVRGWTLTPDVRLRFEYNGRVWVGEADGLITHLASGDQFVWECKTHRAGANKYLDQTGAKRSHQVQAQWYAKASNARGCVITYVSREGSSAARSFLVPRDDETVERLMDRAHAVREGHEEARPLEPKVTELKRAPAQKYLAQYPGRYHKRGTEWVKIEEHPLCSYCDYYKSSYCGGSMAAEGGDTE